MVFSAEIQELEGLRTANTRTWVPIVEQEDGSLGPDPGAGYTELAGGLHWNSAQSGDEPIWLEPVRKGSRILNLTSPSGPGKPPAEGAVTFSSNLSGWVGSMLCSLLFGGYFQ